MLKSYLVWEFKNREEERAFSFLNPPCGAGKVKVGNRRSSETGLEGMAYEELIP